MMDLSNETIKDLFFTQIKNLTLEKKNEEDE